VGQTVLLNLIHDSLTFIVWMKNWLSNPTGVEIVGQTSIRQDELRKLQADPFSRKRMKVFMIFRNIWCQTNFQTWEFRVEFTVCFEAHTCVRGWERLFDHETQTHATGWAMRHGTIICQQQRSASTLIKAEKMFRKATTFASSVSFRLCVSMFSKFPGITENSWILWSHKSFLWEIIVLCQVTHACLPWVCTAVKGCCGPSWSQTWTTLSCLKYEKLLQCLLLRCTPPLHQVFHILIK